MKTKILVTVEVSVSREGTQTAVGKPSLYVTGDVSDSPDALGCPMLIAVADRLSSSNRRQRLVVESFWRMWLIG